MTNSFTSSTTTRSTAKRRKHTHHHQPLLPGLPDHIAHLCLSHVPPSILYTVCHSWRSLIYSPLFPPFLSIYALFLSPPQTTTTTSDQIPTHHLSNTSLKLSSFDPISSTWHTLPPLPPPPPNQPPLHLLLRHPSFLSRYLPIQSVSVSGNLILVAATTYHFLPALPRPLIFNPITQKWTFGPPLSSPRRWCATGASRDTLYVASGIGSHYNTDVARSLEKWDLKIINHHHHHNQRKKSVEMGWKWEKLGGLRDGKFSREAIEAVGWRNKLCMVNVKGVAAKQGVVYDVEKDLWEEMPEGMLVGWRGPVASMNEEIMYMVDEYRGVLKSYDHQRDMWVEMVVCEKLKGAESIAAGGGRVCVVCGGGVGIVVVDVVAASLPRLWVVDTPPGFQAVAIHVLPRLSQPEFQPPVLLDSESMD